MLQAYFESLKYVGHLLPISFLRIFLGYYYLQLAFHDWKVHVLGHSIVSDVLVEALNKTQMPFWYRFFLTEHLMTYWSIYAFVLVGLQLIIGISYLIGYVVRPVAILGLLVSLNYLAITNMAGEPYYKLLIACHVLMAWVGAGRCLGFDYYFYKKYRGIWW